MQAGGFADSEWLRALSCAKAGWGAESRHARCTAQAHKLWQHRDGGRNTPEMKGAGHTSQSQSVRLCHLHGAGCSHSAQTTTPLSASGAAGGPGEPLPPAAGPHLGEGLCPATPCLQLVHVLHPAPPHGHSSLPGAQPTRADFPFCLPPCALELTCWLPRPGSAFEPLGAAPQTALLRAPELPDWVRPGNIWPRILSLTVACGELAV